MCACVCVCLSALFVQCVYDYFNEYTQLIGVLGIALAHDQPKAEPRVNAKLYLLKIEAGSVVQTLFIRGESWQTQCNEHNYISQHVITVNNTQ